MSSFENASQPDLEAGGAQVSRKNYHKCVHIDMTGTINLDATVRTHTETNDDSISSTQDLDLDAYSTSSPMVYRIPGVDEEVGFINVDSGPEDLNLSTMVISVADQNKNDKEIRSERKAMVEDPGAHLGPNEQVRFNEIHPQAEELKLFTPTASAAEYKNTVEDNRAKTKAVVVDAKIQFGSDKKVGVSAVHSRPKELQSRRKKTDKQLIFQKDTMAIDPNDEIRRLRKVLETRDRQLEEYSNQNRSLKARLSKMTIGPSLKFQLIVAFTAGFFGYSPPLWFEFERVLKWITCCGCKYSKLQESSKGNQRSADGNHNGNTPIISKRQSRARLRLVIFFIIFLVDFADSILDFVISTREIFGAPMDDPSEDTQAVRNWAIWLFFATIVSRTLGGVFAIFYHRIEKSKQEFSYVLVEMTIVCVEDMAALCLLVTKKNNGQEWSQLDYANVYLTLVCGIVFLLPSLINCKDGYTVFSLCFAGAMTFFFNAIFGSNNGVFALDDNLLMAAYTLCNAMQLCFSAYWVHGLRKENQQSHEQSDLGSKLEETVDSMELGLRRMHQKGNIEEHL